MAQWQASGQHRGKVGRCQYIDGGGRCVQADTREARDKKKKTMEDEFVDVESSRVDSNNNFKTTRH